MALFLLLCVLATVLTLNAIKPDPAAPATSFSTLMNGKTSAAMEKAYAKALAGKDLIMATWGSIGYGMFRSGSKGAVIGRDGWLYTDEEFSPTGTKAEAAYHENMAHIAAAQRFLKARGVALRIILIPAKTRLYPEHLYHPMPKERQPIYENTLAALRAEGITAVDALSVMESLKREGKQPFMRTDTHWSPDATLAVAEQVRAVAPAGLKEKSHTLNRIAAENYLGDLGDFVPTGFARPFVGPASEPLARLEVNADAPQGDAPNGDGLFAEENVEAALIGTSYSAVEKWNFEGALKYALHADVLNLADPGEGPMKPMAKFLAGHDFAAQPLKLVIWEIPERFLPVHYDVAFPVKE